MVCVSDGCFGYAEQILEEWSQNTASLLFIPVYGRRGDKEAVDFAQKMGGISDFASVWLALLIKLIILRSGYNKCRYILCTEWATDSGIPRLPRHSKTGEVLDSQKFMRPEVVLVLWIEFSSEDKPSMGCMGSCASYGVLLQSISFEVCIDVGKDDHVWGLGEPVSINLKAHAKDLRETDHPADIRGKF
ncbi:hypothetical protein IMY05_C4535000400 [Salix suchowensis]|nr:hypothetical protein IMY05_C4535000400 [Salix suchowensis]